MSGIPRNSCLAFLSSVLSVDFHPLRIAALVPQSLYHFPFLSIVLSLWSPNGHVLKEHYFLGVPECKTEFSQETTTQLPGVPTSVYNTI